MKSVKPTDIDPTTRCPVCGMEAESNQHACQRCRSDPFPDDTELRASGFRIVSRPGNDFALWRSPGTKQHRQGLVLAHQQALRLIREPALV